jgi:hypothetical protein
MTGEVISLVVFRLFYRGSDATWEGLPVALHPKNLNQRSTFNLSVLHFLHVTNKDEKQHTRIMITGDE